MFSAKAMIHSKNDFDNVQIVFQNGYNDVIALYNNNYYSAVFNLFVQCYYVDDIYGRISEDTLRKRNII